MSTAIGIHLSVAMVSLLLGVYQLIRPKGTPNHKMLGKIWMLSMLLASFSSFFIAGVFPAMIWHLSAIHGLSVWVIISVTISWLSVRRGNIKQHKNFAIGGFVGTLVAGLFAVFMEGRMLNLWLFG